jgi:phosphate transport system substrate-binding protein
VNLILITLKTQHMSNRKLFFLSLMVLVLSACSENSSGPSGATDLRLRGTVSLDGSSTVFPISEAVAEEFLKTEPLVRVTVGVSGTGGGFEKFLANEIDIINASRAIWETESAAARQNGIDFLEIPVAYDGISVVVNKQNDWVDMLTLEELNLIWRPDSPVNSWRDIRPEWPDVPVKLYAPGADSGTFEYFSEAVNGAPSVSRSDFTASEDDNILVQGISGDPNALGFFGFAYYTANSSRLKIVPVDSGSGPIAPTVESIANGSYSPLTRLIYIYLKKSRADDPAIRAFVNFYIDQAAVLSEEVGYVPLPESYYQAAREAFAAF